MYYDDCLRIINMGDSPVAQSTPRSLHRQAQLRSGNYNQRVDLSAISCLVEIKMQPRRHTLLSLALTELGGFSRKLFRSADHRGLAVAVWGILQMALAKWTCNAHVDVRLDMATLGEFWDFFLLLDQTPSVGHAGTVSTPALLHIGHQYGRLTGIATGKSIGEPESGPR